MCRSSLVDGISYILRVGTLYSIYYFAENGVNVKAIFKHAPRHHTLETDKQLYVRCSLKCESSKMYIYYYFDRRCCAAIENNAT